MDMATTKHRKGKAGRPALPPGVARDVILRFMASPAEVELLDSVATRHNLNRSEVIRRAIHILSIYPALMPPEMKSMHFERRPVVSHEDFDTVYGPGASKSSPK
jgi:hypothetical protein